MRALQLGILAVGLGLAGVGVHMANNYITDTQARMAAVEALNASMENIETVPVLVAARPLRYGEPVQPGDVREVAWPANALPEGVYHILEDLVPDISRPRVALRAMEINEPILAVKVSDPGQPAGIAAMLTPGQRAFTIRVDQNSGISGTLRVSDTVDIYWTGVSPEQVEVTRLLATGVRIIALDEDPDQDRTFNGVPRSVTVESSPEMVATLAQGQSTGRLTMSIVGLDDTTALNTIQVDRSSLLGIQEQVVVAPEQCHVRTRRGNEVVLIEIPCTN
ncbi:MAG: Flp pilus assembly protein CpaB [Paracoccaceae bacterium]